MIEIERRMTPSLHHIPPDGEVFTSSSSSSETIVPSSPSSVVVVAAMTEAAAVAAASSIATVIMPPPSSVLLSSSPMDDAQLFWELNDTTNNASQSSFNVLPLLMDERKQQALGSRNRIPHDGKESMYSPPRSSEEEDGDDEATRTRKPQTEAAAATAVAPAVPCITTKATAVSSVAAAAAASTVAGTVASVVVDESTQQEGQIQPKTKTKKVVRKKNKKPKKNIKKKVRFCKKDRNEIHHVPNVIDLVEDYLLEMGMTDSISDLITIDEPTILLMSNSSSLPESNTAAKSAIKKNEIGIVGGEETKVPSGLADIDSIPSVEALTASLDELTCSIHLSSLPHHGICGSTVISSNSSNSIEHTTPTVVKEEEAGEEEQEKENDTTAQADTGGGLQEATGSGGGNGSADDDDDDDDDDDEEEVKDQITIDAIKVLWYTAGAYLRIKDEMKRTLIKHSKGQLALEEILVEGDDEEDMAVGVVVSEDDSTTTTTIKEGKSETNMKKYSRNAQVYCMRGLEPRTKFGARRRKTNRKLAFQAVWDVQVEQWKLHGDDTTVDPSLVSMAYQPKTRHCRHVAIQIAQRDEFFVLQE